MALAKDDCPCGRTSLRIEKIIGRIDDLCKIPGVLFSPQSVEEVIRGEFPQIVEYEIVVTRPSIIEYPGTTVVVYSGQRAVIDEYLNLILEKEE
jgi:phenylacetate-CoA ligase